MKTGLKPIYFLAMLAVMDGCAGEPDPIVTEPTHPDPALKITSPKTEDQYIVGDVVEVKIEIKDPSKVTDLRFLVDDTLNQSDLRPESQTVRFESKNGRVGHVKIAFSYRDENGEEHGDMRTIVFFSDLVPAEKKAVKVSELPHDVSSYTQGLEFYQGKLFEGTGQNGHSILAEVDLQTGKQKRVHELEGNIFGEGITILNDTIYQITWENEVCFVYDMNFNLLREMNYTGEGWGLCNDGTHLIMSNGSREIVWRDPRTFEIRKRITVFDNDDSIEQLNELELINGRLFSNVYGEDYIVEIDTASGKVLSRIDCKNIVKEGRAPGSDVLNGIAWNPATGKLYITGKWWPKMYEVKFE